MQPLEITGLVLFLVSYLYSGFRALLTPEGYREEELRFYSKGGMRMDEIIVFGAGALSFLVVILHAFFETLRVGEILLYAQVILFVIVLPFHFMDLYRGRMVSTLKKKSDKDYKNAGFRKVVVSGLMILAAVVIQG
jgi:hypothetical protein